MKNLITEAVERLKKKGNFDIILKDIFEEVEIIKNEL
tara:strand:+ start:720 stop:830 length:111 start_codon:yes stop_codon:yes gene_type:complete